MALKLIQLQTELRAMADPTRAKTSTWFFKTGKGDYGESDKFIGIKVPDQRRIAKKYRDLNLTSVIKLLHSPIHEERLTAIFILVDQFKRAGNVRRTRIYRLYLNNTEYINNWDIVDSSAADIVGGYLVDKDRTPLIKLAKSGKLWERRIAIIATHHFIKHQDPIWALKVAEILLNDSHDLIHKAVGWMLREVGNRCARDVEIDFLDQHYQQMPRTMLRYAIEKFEPALRKRYLQKTV